MSGYMRMEQSEVERLCDDAIERSESHNEIVTIKIRGPSAADAALDYLMAQAENADYTRAERSLIEVWGWNDGASNGSMDWRVHIRITDMVDDY